MSLCLGMTGALVDRIHISYFVSSTRQRAVDLVQVRTSHGHEELCVLAHDLITSLTCCSVERVSVKVMPRIFRAATWAVSAINGGGSIRQPRLYCLDSKHDFLVLHKWGTRCQMNVEITTVLIDGFKRFLKTILFSRY